MTTLTEARKALLKLVDSFPVGSTYANQAAILADYLDKQVPLNIENKELRAQLAAKGGSSFARKGKVTPVNATNFIMTSGEKHALRADLGDRRFTVVPDA